MRITLISLVPVFASTKYRAASVIAAGERDPYTWDFEGFSQSNYYGDRQRFNGNGCVNFHCVNFQSYKGLPNKEYIFLRRRRLLRRRDPAHNPGEDESHPTVGLNKCHELKGDGVSSFQGHDSSTYTFYKDAGCKSTVLEKSKGPDSRTNTYMTPMSVMID
ncbi:hypothetical protein BGZ92_011726 [Podila epicladia]|nr:hypothetical protein BGZ92_011726 [Podila epicladia]